MLMILMLMILNANDLEWAPDKGSPVLGQVDWVPANDMRGSPFHSEDLRFASRVCATRNW